MKRKIAAYAQMMRVSNAPTVVTNVLLGAALAGGAMETEPLIAAIACVFSIYFAGMILNDIFDAPHDVHHKPGRPIPSGAVSGREAIALTSILLAVGVGASYSLGMRGFILAMALIACVVLYDTLHKRSAWLCLAMGACRALAYAIGFASMGGDFSRLSINWLMGAIVVYIALLTFVARREEDGSAGLRARLSLLMPLTIAPPAFAIAIERGSIGIWAAFALALFVAWMLRSCWLLLRNQPDVKGAVMGWLSGICLFDAALLSLNGNEAFSFVAIGCFVITALAHRFVPGT